MGTALKFKLYLVTVILLFEISIPLMLQIHIYVVAIFDS